MPLFPSTEWMADFCARLAAKPAAGQLAAALAGTYRFVVEPDGPLRERHVYELSITPGGDGADVRLLDGAAGEPRLELTAGYGRWKQLIRGELDLAMAFLLRRLKVKGDIGAITKHASSSRPLMDALAEVDTIWLEDAGGAPAAPGDAGGTPAAPGDAGGTPAAPGDA